MVRTKDEKQQAFKNSMHAAAVKLLPAILFQFCQCHFNSFPGFFNILHTVGKRKPHTVGLPEGIAHHAGNMSGVEQIHTEVI
jgi:hypothetical protein